MSDGTLLATGVVALLAVGSAFAGGRGSRARVRLTPGLMVRVSAGSGIDSGRVGMVVGRQRIKTDGRGVPLIEGRYRPVDWSKEVALQWEDGGLGTMFKNRLEVLRGSSARARPQVDEHMVTELELYIDNTHALYNQLQSIRANLVNKIASGTYDHSKAPKLWMFVVDEGARRYNKEFGQGSTLVGIDKATREATAKSLADRFLEEASEYESMLHKKHQRNPEARARLLLDARHLRK